MATFRVHASETVYYMVDVEAESKSEVQNKIDNGDIEFGQPYDGFGFDVDEIEEL